MPPPRRFATMSNASAFSDVTSGSRISCWCTLLGKYASRSLRDLLDLERHGLLRGVRVLGAGVDLELLDQLTAELVVRKHALDGELDGPLRVLLEEVFVPDLLETARVAGVPVGDLGVALVAGQRHLARVDDDHEVAGVDVGRERRLV